MLYKSPSSPTSNQARVSIPTMQLQSFLAALAFVGTVAAANPTVYLIRHGEKPASGNGLSAQGQKRAQCLRTVFGATSQYQIGHIMAQTPKSGMALCFQFLIVINPGQMANGNVLMIR